VVAIATLWRNSRRNRGGAKPAVSENLSWRKLIELAEIEGVIGAGLRSLQRRDSSMPAAWRRKRHGGVAGITLETLGIAHKENDSKSMAA